MWKLTPHWKNIMHELLIAMGVKPNLKSHNYIPFVYVDMLSEEIEARTNKVAFDHGFPARHCFSFGQLRHLPLGV
jgi:hypothetical protein